MLLTGRSARLLFVGLAVAALIVCAQPRRAAAQFFPLFDRDSSAAFDEPRETWLLWPLATERETSSTLTQAIHPLISRYHNRESGGRGTDVLWPIYSFRYRPETMQGADYRRHFLFPIYYDRKERRGGTEMSDRLLLPVWFEGRQGDRGRYLILFPLVWYASNARMAVPLFPPREQTFGAIFPLVGDFRGYWNRDRIAFFLWPLLVYSSEGTGEDFNEIYSFVWPFLGIYKGPKVSGFRIWPLFGHVRKEGEFRRSYWLWPLGHRRVGRISKTNEDEEDVWLFIPFYANFKRPNISLDMLFPFYGRLEVGQRISTGYLLAIYNVDVNLRQGTREDRYFWFLIRSKRRLPDIEPQDADPNATVGGGFFPFYVRVHNERRVAKSILWPFHQYRFNQHDEFTYERSYVIPFYARQAREFDDGRYSSTRFVFPFFRERRMLDGHHSSNSLHLFFYTYLDPMDRNWAPLWTVWEKEQNANSGEKSIRWLKNMWRYEERADGSSRKRFNLLFYEYESHTTSTGITTGSTRLFFGLVGRHREPELKTELLGFRF